MSCSNNLRNHSLAIQNFHEVNRIIPVGRMRRQDLDYGWSYYLLPLLEQQAVYSLFNRELPWYHPSQVRHSEKVISIYRCPSSAKSLRGDIDYAGIMGTLINFQADHPFDRGSLVYVSDEAPEISLESVTDGISNTICISESHDRNPPAGLWISGVNCVSHDIGGLNINPEGIRSLHIGGAHAVRLDCSVHFLSNNLDLAVLGALITRNGNESISLPE